MAVISSDIFRLAAVKLVAGAIPANPVFRVARISGESLDYQPSVSQSSELDGTGQLRDSILTGVRSSGSIEAVLCRHDFLMEMMASVMRSTWTANVLNVGSTLDQYLIEKRFIGPAGNIYHRINKAVPSSLSIGISPGNEMTTSISVIGGTTDFVEALIAGATYPDPGTYSTFTAPLVTEVTVAGITNALCFSDLNIELNSNVRGIECIGTLGFKEQVLGRFTAQISGSAYFVDNTLLDYLVSQATFPVTIELTDAATNPNSFEFFFPRCKMTSGNANAGGTGQDVVSNIGIQALYDPVTSTTVRITRTLAV